MEPESVESDSMETMSDKVLDRRVFFRGASLCRVECELESEKWFEMVRIFLKMLLTQPVLSGKSNTFCNQFKSASGRENAT